MKHFFSIFMMILLVFSCKDNSIERPSKPENLIPEEKMVNVLYDMILVSAAKGVNKQIMETNGFYPDEYIYTKHQIDSIQFKESNNYYVYDVERYERIYAKVKRKLDTDKKMFQERIEADKKRRDSVVKSNRKKGAERNVKQSKKDTVNGIKPDLLKKEKQFP